MYSLEKDVRIYTLAPLSPKQVYEDQIQLKTGYEEEQHVSAKVEEQKDSAKMEKQAEQHGEDVRKREKKVSHELKTKRNKVSALRTLGEGHNQEQKSKKKAESGEKKERVRKEEFVEKVGKHLNFFAKSNDLKHAYLSDLPMILFVYKEAFFNSDDLDSCIPSVVKVLLQEFEDVFPDDIPSGLSPIRGIEHQIDFIPRASIPNRPAYRSNPEETKELQRASGGVDVERIHSIEHESLCSSRASCSKKGQNLANVCGLSSYQ
jgi:hypothetical protein